MRALGFGFFLLSFTPLISAAPSPKEMDRAQELKKIIQKETQRFAHREKVRRDLLEELDAINADQNRVREKIVELQSNHREISMAHANLTMENKKQRETQAFEKNRLIALARFIYKIRKDGFLKFIVTGENLSQLAGRIRILYRTFRSHTQLTQKLEERAERLRQSEAQIGSVQTELTRLLQELADQEKLLGNYLLRKREMISRINQKQFHYQRMVQEYRQISGQVSQLFSEFELEKPTVGSGKLARHSLPFPVLGGKLLKHFGRVVHEQFGTVVFHKGIEVESEHNSPVSAILNGTVEFSGWLKGLGNVLIIRHTGGMFSLSAHLFKVIKEKGAAVEQGETIGFVGDTGTDEKASLYFEIRENGKAVNPLAYFSRESLQRIL